MIASSTTPSVCRDAATTTGATPSFPAHLWDTLLPAGTALRAGSAVLVGSALLAGSALLTVSAWIAPLSGQQPAFGPLTYEEGAPLHRVSYTATMETAELVGRGRMAVEVVNGFSNIFEQDSSATHVLFLDMERLVTATTVRWGATETLELGARLTLETTGPGALDDLILGWHEALGFGQANRDRFPSDAYRQVLEGEDGTVYLDEPRRTFGIHDARLLGKWRLWRSKSARSALSLRGTLRLPAGAHSGGVDGGATLLGRAGLGAWYVHGMLGISRAWPSARLRPVLRRTGTFLGLAVERSLAGWIAALAQFQMESAALHTFEHREIDRSPTNLVLGFAGRFGRSWSWDASFQEDVPADTPAVDFTATLRVTRHW